MGLSIGIWKGPYDGTVQSGRTIRPGDRHFAPGTTMQTTSWDPVAAASTVLTEYRIGITAQGRGYYDPAGVPTASRGQISFDGNGRPFISPLGS